MGSLENHERKLAETNPPADSDALKRWWKQTSRDAYKAHYRDCPAAEERTTIPEEAAAVPPGNGPACTDPADNRMDDLGLMP